MERNVMGELNVYRGGPARSRTSAKSRGGTAWTGTRSPSTGGRASLDWQHLFGRFREGQPLLSELDRRHVAQRRVDPEVVVPVHVVRELGPELARRAERLAVDELGLQYPVGRLVDGVVVGAALGRQRPLYAEGLEHQVDLGVVELAAAVRVEYLDVRDREGGRRERRLDRPGVLSGPGGVADDPPCCGGRRAGGRSSTRPRRTRRPGRRIYGCAAPCRRGRARRRSARRPR